MFSSSSNLGYRLEIFEKKEARITSPGKYVFQARLHFNHEKSGLNEYPDKFKIVDNNLKFDQIFVPHQPINYGLMRY